MDKDTLKFCGLHVIVCRARLFNIYRMPNGKLKAMAGGR